MDDGTFNVARFQDPLTIQTILNRAKTIAIVGLSANPLRGSYFVGFYLRRHGYRISTRCTWRLPSSLTILARTACAPEGRAPGSSIITTITTPWAFATASTGSRSRRVRFVFSVSATA